MQISIQSPAGTVRITLFDEEDEIVPMPTLLFRGKPKTGYVPGILKASVLVMPWANPTSLMPFWEQ